MRRRVISSLSTVFIAAFVLIAVLPLGITFGKSLERPEQYRIFLTESPLYLRLVWNSLALVIPVLIGQVLIAPLAAFGFWQWRWKYKDALFFLYMIVMLMPLQLTLVPNYIVAKWLGLGNSAWAVILPAMFHPLGVFLIRQQIQDFPKDALEAARLDGATEYQVYRKILRPNLSAVLSALVILLFTDNWNIVDQAVVFLRDSYRQPMSVYLNQMLGSDPGIFYAAAVFYALPALLAFLLAKEYLIEGISMSGIKS